MLFMNGRRLAQICVAMMHKAGYLDGTFKIDDPTKMAKWMLYDMMPTAKLYFSDEELSMLELDRADFLYEMNMREKDGNVRYDCWHGDFVHEMMDWFERSYLDGYHNEVIHDRFGREYHTEVPDNKLFTCPITDEKAIEILSRATYADSAMLFCKEVLVETLPALVECFERF